MHEQAHPSLTTKCAATGLSRTRSALQLLLRHERDLILALLSSPGSRACLLQKEAPLPRYLSMTSGRGPSTDCTSPATRVLMADRQCASRHCRNHSMSRLPLVALLLGASLAASAVNRSNPTCTPQAWHRSGDIPIARQQPLG